MGEHDIFLRLKNISKAFPGVQALDKVTVDIQRGEVHAIIGENGAGKTTLMNIIFGALNADDGTMYINDEEVNIRKPKDALDCGVNMIFQEITLMLELTVAENIFIDRLFQRSKMPFVRWKKLFKDSKEILERLDIQIDPKALVKDLSIGQQQLVEIAKAVSANIKIVIMDEPTSSLSGSETQKLFSIINQLKKQKVSVIYITHKLDEIFKIADRVTVLRDGKCIDTLYVTKTNKEELISLMVGRSIEDVYVKEEYTKGEIILEVKNLNREEFFKNISFILRSGEILGFYGLVGAGRTELALSILGFYPLEGGEIYIKGNKVRINTPNDAILNGIGYLPEDRKTQSIFNTLTVKDNITVSNIKKYSDFSFIRKFKEINASNEYIQRLNIRTPSVYQMVVNLSGGNQQKVVLSRILDVKPKIMILDEPTRGIDVGAKAEVHQTIKELAGSGIGIMLISSEMPEILRIADRIITMRNGEITGDYIRDEVDQEVLLKATSL